MGDYFIKKYMLKDVLQLETKTRVCLSGFVTNIKNRPKYFSFTLDDNTGVISCILFRNENIKVNIEVGSMISITGEYEIDNYYADNFKKVKVYKYSILNSINELHYEHLSFFLQEKLEKESK